MLKSSQDILGRLANVTEDATPSDGTDDPQTDTGYAYDLLGRKRAQLTIAPGDTVTNSVETSYLYDSIGRLDVMTDTDSNGNTLASYDYTVRADGKRTSSTEQTWFDENSDGVQDAGEVKTTTTSWTYDDAGRLTDEVLDHWDDAVDQTESFTYDLTGNRAALDCDKGNNGTIDEAITYQYDANDRLLDEVLDSIVDSDDTTTTYAYDQIQQTSKTVTSTTNQLPVSSQQFTYNLQGRMASVVNETYDASGTLTSREQTGYEYDSKSYRVKLTNETDAAFDGNFTLDSTSEFLASHRNKTGYAQTLQESKFDVDGNLAKQIDYTFGDDEISQRTREFDASGNVTSDEALVFGHDGHGSVRVLYDLTDSAAKIIQAFTFSAYGKMIALHNAAAQSIAVSGRLSSTGYSGETFDAASQQQYLRARFYNPTNGRFNRLDDFSGNNQDPQSLHKYAYVHGDPISGIDPSGKAKFYLLQQISTGGLQEASAYAFKKASRNLARSTINFVAGYYRNVAYEKSLFAYYQRLMQSLLLVGNHLHANGMVGFDTQFPWLSGVVNVVGASGSSTTGLYATHPTFGSKMSPPRWPRLGDAISYSMQQYGDINDWTIVEGSSYNLHGIFMFWAPTLNLSAGAFFSNNEHNAIRDLIHEPLHDQSKYGYGHENEISNIVNTLVVSPESPQGSDLTMLIDFLNIAVDASGVSLWRKIRDWAGPRP